MSHEDEANMCECRHPSDRHNYHESRCEWGCGCEGFTAMFLGELPTKAEREMLLHDDEGDEHPCPDCGSFDCFCTEAETTPEPMDDAGLPGR